MYERTPTIVIVIFIAAALVGTVPFACSSGRYRVFENSALSDQATIVTTVPSRATGERPGPVVLADGSRLGDRPARWARVSAGSFLMGSPHGEYGRSVSHREIRHRVTLTHDFEMQTTEVTRRQYYAARGSIPPDEQYLCLDCPIERVSWHQAAEYCNRLSDEQHLDRCYACRGHDEMARCAPSVAYDTPYECPGYRLPTEAEWEYAARAGTTTATYAGDLRNRSSRSWRHPAAHPLSRIAWYIRNSEEATHAVGTLEPNAWGLYDMLGNVAEWCHDFSNTATRQTYPWPRYGFIELSRGPRTLPPATDPYGPPTGTTRIIRGGTFLSWDYRVRAAARSWDGPGTRNNCAVGFRPVRTLPLSSAHAR